jgi:hypothetical protein
VNSAGQSASCDIKANNDLDCLTNKALSGNPVVCQSCHYTPALDLAQVGPLGGSAAAYADNGSANCPFNSNPANCVANGRVQRVNKTMSRVMHEFHGALLMQNKEPVFPDMPPPNDSGRTDSSGNPVINTLVSDTLTKTCYNCHPGRNTKCLRGAMFNGGMVCQDCHGQMRDVGNDFSVNMAVGSPFPNSADLSRRIPWANEPGCQSCHTGDAVNLNHPNGAIVAPDGIRLLQAWTGNNATPIESPNSRFAENESSGKRALYRLSTGHGGVFCEGCHGSTHAEWPVTPNYTGNWPPPAGTFVANENVAPGQLQGHTGVIIECSTCHGTAMDSQVTLDGPHGMHPVGNVRFVNGGHEDMAEGSSGRQKCAACHGAQGQGTVLSVAKVDRQVSGRTITKGTQVSCGICHGNPFTGGGD